MRVCIAYTGLQSKPGSSSLFRLYLCLIKGLPDTFTASELHQLVITASARTITTDGVLKYRIDDISENLSPFATTSKDGGGTSPWMGVGRTMQEQLSRAKSGILAEEVQGRVT